MEAAMRSGIPTLPMEGENLYFPPFSIAKLGIREYFGKIYFTAPAFSDLRRRLVEFPVSFFRRNPIPDDSLAFYTLERAFNLELAEAVDEITRYEILCKAQIVNCVKVWDLRQYKWKKIDDDHSERTDTLIPMKLFELKPVVIEDKPKTKKGSSK